MESKRIDFRILYGMIEPNSRVLDLGCGEGELLYYLARHKNAQVQGVEINEGAIYKCVEKGVSVFHSDIDSGLCNYPDKAFDYVILNQSMQEVKKVDLVLREALRVGKKVIVGFPNFAHIRARMRIFFQGKTPITESLPYRWYDTPNLHFLTISDFQSYCQNTGVRILRAYFLGHNRTISLWPNLLALNAIFEITK